LQNWLFAPVAVGAAKNAHRLTAVSREEQEKGKKQSVEYETVRRVSSPSRFSLDVFGQEADFQNRVLYSSHCPENRAISGRKNHGCLDTEIINAYHFLVPHEVAKEIENDKT